MPPTTALRPPYFQDMKSPVHVDITKAKAVAPKNIFIGWSERFGTSDLGVSGFDPSAFTLGGDAAFARWKVEGALLMQLWKMNHNPGRDVAVSSACLVQTEHLEAGRDSEEEDCWREDTPNVIV